jgi:hypothetical protein
MNLLRPRKCCPYLFRNRGAKGRQPPDYQRQHAMMLGHPKQQIPTYATLDGPRDPLIACPLRAMHAAGPQQIKFRIHAWSSPWTRDRWRKM